MPTSPIDIQLTFPDIQFLLSTRIQINLVHKVHVRIEKSEIVDTLQDVDEDPIRQILIPIVICCASAPFPPSLLESGAEHHSSPVALTVDANEDALVSRPAPCSQMNGTRVFPQSRTSMPRPHVEETRSAFPDLVLVFRHIGVVFPAVTALPHRLTDARLHVALVSLGIEKEVSELQRHGRVREGHVVEEGVLSGLWAGCEAGFSSISVYL